MLWVLFLIVKCVGGGRNVSKTTTNVSCEQLVQDEFCVNVCLLPSKDSNYDEFFSLL